MDTMRRKKPSIAAQLWLVQLVVSTIAYFQMFMSQMSVASCSGTRCDYWLLSTALNTFTVGAVVLLASAAAASLFLEHLQRPFIWPPIAGILATVALFATMYAVSRAALDLPLATSLT